MDDVSQLVVFVGLLVLGVESVVAAVCGVLIYGVYRDVKRTHPDLRRESAYLFRLFVRDWRVAGSAAVLAAIFIYSGLRQAIPELGLAPAPQPWTLLVGFICIGLMEWGVIADYIQFRNDQRLGAVGPNEAG